MDLPESLAGSPATKMYFWDQAEEGSLGTLLNSEEQILNSMFEACDPQRTGFVAVTHILAYLEAMTGRSPRDARLQTLARSLDPNGEGPQATVDLDTFLVVMRDWIAACQLDGGLELEEETAFEGALTPQQLPSGCPEEPANLESFGGEDPRPELPATADLLSSLEDLELSNRRLAGENAKLQRSVETAEEGSARLGEEIAALRKQLRSTQQALQFAKAVDEELEDLKSLAKSLEEQNRSLLAQARQTEKEQQHLVAEIETLQKENGKLLAERDGVKRRTEELAMEKDALKELRLEISHLEEQLSQTHERPEDSPASSDPQQALVPVEKELVPVRRPGWGQLCLCPLHPQQLRVAQHPLIPAPVLGLLLLLLLFILLLGQSPPPTWPHLQLCYLQPPPV
ncbi:Coiled-coil domain-containing protein 155 [Pteropus alecto]|uniref:Coiled-coil domain-containing protein 155 n=1 Tax=Pteropus alecto TaxID=9402 RepID=L5L5J7_PTEAL|nr:Coiled-coil domain-containing protein 155 [Pteropus alecto]